MKNINRFLIALLTIALTNNLAQGTTEVQQMVTIYNTAQNTIDSIESLKNAPTKEYYYAIARALDNEAKEDKTLSDFQRQTLRGRARDLRIDANKEGQANSQANRPVIPAQ
jgi:hypothetical protein